MKGIDGHVAEDWQIYVFGSRVPASCFERYVVVLKAKRIASALKEQGVQRVDIQ